MYAAQSVRDTGKQEQQKNEGSQFVGRTPDAGEVLQRAKAAPQTLMPGDVLQLQQIVGNRAVCQLLKGIPAVQRRENRTGLPDSLKTGVESLSGLDMSDVRVHYNSDKPARVGALAYTQGTDIHVAPGQERHLPHEAWHVVQQAQGRVRPTMQLKGVAVNDDAGLEREASEMGERVERNLKDIKPVNNVVVKNTVPQNVIQCNWIEWLKNQPWKNRANAAISTVVAGLAYGLVAYSCYSWQESLEEKNKYDGEFYVFCEPLKVVAAAGSAFTAHKVLALCGLKNEDPLERRIAALEEAVRPVNQSNVADESVDVSEVLSQRIETIANKVAEQEKLTRELKEGATKQEKLTRELKEGAAKQEELRKLEKRAANQEDLTRELQGRAAKQDKLTGEIDVRVSQNKDRVETHEEQIKNLKEMKSNIDKEILGLKLLLEKNCKAVEELKSQVSGAVENGKPSEK